MALFKQIAAMMMPTWAVFRSGEDPAGKKQYIYEGIPIVGLTEDGILIPLVGDMFGDYKDPRQNPQFLCFIYNQDELTRENLEQIDADLHDFQQKNVKNPVI
jgi:hypothetical protein